MFVKKKSKIHGKGIFSICKIKKSRVFCRIKLNKIYFSSKRRCAYIGKGRWVSDNVLNYVNHSCNPNAKLILAKNPYLKSVKLINAGDEITVNYNLTEKKGRKVKCKCKSLNCKGYFLIR